MAMSNTKLALQKIKFLITHYDQMKNCDKNRLLEKYSNASER